MATSTDGLTWERLPMTFEANLLAVAVLGDRIVTAGSVTTHGAAWEQAPIASGAYAGGVAVVDGGFVAVGNLIGQELGESLSWTSTDGLTWEAGVPFGTTNVRFDAAAGNGTTVVAGGSCQSASCDTVLWVGEVTE